MKNKWWTVIAYLHGRNSDCAANKCKAVHIQAINEEEASFSQKSSNRRIPKYSTCLKAN